LINDNNQFEMVYYESFNSSNMPETPITDSVSLAIGKWYVNDVNAPIDSAAYGNIGNAFLFDGLGDFIESPLLTGVDSINLRHTIAQFNTFYNFRLLDDQDNILIQTGNDDPTWHATGYKFTQPYTGRIRIESGAGNPYYIDEFKAFRFNNSNEPVITLSNVNPVTGLPIR